jgi:hypothetical protein
MKLRENHFYIVALYYTYTDSSTGITTEVGLFRYLYTNGIFASYLPAQHDFSNLSYPVQDIQIITGSSTPTVNYILQNKSLDNSRLLFDPLLQTYAASNRQKKLTAYGIGPYDYFHDTA